jgi:hypothetical protein
VREKGISVEDSIKYNSWIDVAKSQGLGDTIEKIASALGIKKCKSCEERRKKLNKFFPYRGFANKFSDVK